MILFNYKKTSLWMKKVFILGFSSIVLCNPCFIEHSFAIEHDDIKVIKKTQKLFTPLLSYSGNGTYSKGVVATVNGCPITIDDIFAMHNAGPFETSMSLPQSVAALHDDYSLILQELITHELLRQDLDARGVFLTEIDMQRAEQEFKASFVMHDALERAMRQQEVENFCSQKAEKTERMEAIESLDTFSQSLMERGLTLRQWRTMLERQVRMQALMHDVLEPAIYISPEDIEAAYRAHPELLQLEKRVQCRLFSTSSIETAEELVQSLRAGKNVHDSGIVGYIDESFLMPYDRLPDAWTAVAKRAEKEFGLHGDDDQYAEIIEEDGKKKVLLIEHILPARTLSIGEAYVRLERVVMEERRAIAYADWLQQVWENADIRLIRQFSLINCYDEEKQLTQESEIK